MNLTYTVGIVQIVQAGYESKPFLAAWSTVREASLGQDGIAVLTVRFTGLDRNHARKIAEYAGGCEI